MEAIFGWNTASDGTNAQANAGAGADDHNVPHLHNAQHDAQHNAQSYQDAGNARYREKYVMARDAPSMGAEDWANASEALIAAQHGDKVSSTARDLKGGINQGPVRVTFEQTEANEASLNKGLLVMDQELTTRCTRMLEILEGQQFPCGAMAQLLIAAARKNVTAPYSFGMTYVTDTWSMRRFGVAKNSRLWAWNGAYEELVELIESMPEEERRYIKVVRDGGGNVESVQVKMPKMTIWTPLRDLRITKQVRVCIFSDEFSEADFADGDVVSAIGYARMGMHGKARNIGKLEYKGGILSADVPVWDVARVERLRALAIQKCNDEGMLGQNVNGRQFNFILGNDVKAVRTKAIALGLIEARDDGGGEGTAILQAGVKALGEQVQGMRTAAEAERATQVQAMADMQEGVVQIQAANEELTREAREAKSELAAMKRAAEELAAIHRAQAEAIRVEAEKAELYREEALARRQEDRAKQACIVRLQEANEALFQKAEASNRALEAMHRAAAERAKAATGETGETAETKLFGAGERAPRLEDQATPSKLEIGQGGDVGDSCVRASGGNADSSRGSADAGGRWAGNLLPDACTTPGGAGSRPWQTGAKGVRHHVSKSGLLSAPPLSALQRATKRRRSDRGGTPLVARGRRGGRKMAYRRRGCGCRRCLGRAGGNTGGAATAGAPQEGGTYRGGATAGGDATTVLPAPAIGTAAVPGGMDVRADRDTSPARTARGGTGSCGCV